MPKSICLVSTIPCFNAQKQLLLFLYSDLLQDKNPNNHNNNIRIPTRYVWSLACFLKDNQIPSGDYVGVDKQWERSFEYNREQHFKGLGKEEEFIINESRLREFYISAALSILDIPKTPEDKVLLTLRRAKEIDGDELLRYRISKANICIPQASYKLLFKKMKVENIVKVFKYIMLERQIIFFSKKTEDIPYITEALLSLISPLY